LIFGSRSQSSVLAPPRRRRQRNDSTCSSSKTIEDLHSASSASLGFFRTQSGQLVPPRRRRQLASSCSKASSFQSASCDSLLPAGSCPRPPVRRLGASQKSLKSDSFSSLLSTQQASTKGPPPAPPRRWASKKSLLKPAAFSLPRTATVEAAASATDACVESVSAATAPLRVSTRLSTGSTKWKRTSLVESERFASALDLDTYERISVRPEAEELRTAELQLSFDSCAGAVPVPPRRRKQLQKDCYSRLAPGLQASAATAAASQLSAILTTSAREMFLLKIIAVKRLILRNS